MSIIISKVNSIATLKSQFPRTEVESIEISLLEQQELMYLAERFLLRLSINHYLFKKLVSFDDRESFDLMTVLMKEYGCTLEPNLMPCYDFSFDIAQQYIFPRLKKSKQHSFLLDVLLKSIDDATYLETPLSMVIQSAEGSGARYLADKGFGKLTIKDLLQTIVLKKHNMDLGDQPSLNLILTANRALIAKQLLYENIKRLSHKEMVIYDISRIY